MPNKPRVLLEVGHGYRRNRDGSLRYDPGARSESLGITEHQAVQQIAQRCALHFLLTHNIVADITDDPDPLFSLGKRAGKYSVFISLHLNAANKSAQGSEVIVHLDATPKDIDLASILSEQLAAGLQIRNRGVKHMPLAILSGARQSAVGAAVLVEPFFLDVPGIPLALWIETSSRIIADVVSAWLTRTSRSVQSETLAELRR